MSPETSVVTKNDVEKKVADTATLAIDEGQAKYPINLKDFSFFNPSEKALDYYAEHVAPILESTSDLRDSKYIHRRLFLAVCTVIEMDPGFSSNLVAELHEKRVPHPSDINKKPWKVRYASEGVKIVLYRRDVWKKPTWFDVIPEGFFGIYRNINSSLPPNWH